MSARQGVVGQRSERVSGFDGGGWEREVAAAAAAAAVVLSGGGVGPAVLWALWGGCERLRYLVERGVNL